MKRVTVGGLTPARSANRATLSRPAIGYEASRARASRRSAGLRESRRWRTSSTTRCSVTDITFHPELGYFGTFLTNTLRSPVILSAKPCHVKSGPASESPRARVAAASTTTRTSGRSRRWARSRSTCRLGQDRSPTSTDCSCRVVGTWTPPSTERSLTPRSGRSTASSTTPSSASSRKPAMGICRGQQVINVAMGGSLQQHLDGHEVRQFGRNHLAHAIEVDPRSELGRAAGNEKIRVNSLHHQAIDKLAPGLLKTASGEDGTVEAVETADGLIVAVQCHPEELASDLPWPAGS